MRLIKGKVIAALTLVAVLGSPAVAQAPSDGYCGCTARCGERSTPASAPWNVCESRCARRFAPTICTTTPGDRMCVERQAAAPVSDPVAVVAPSARRAESAGVPEEPAARPTVQAPAEPVAGDADASGEIVGQAPPETPPEAEGEAHRHD